MRQPGPAPRRAGLALLVACVAAPGCGRAAGSAAPELLRARVVHAYSHDRSAFTEGLELIDGRLYESTGLNGHSSVRRIDLATGQTEARADLEPALFGEGLTRVGDRLFQLTWQNRKVLVWRLSDLSKLGELPLTGEGWGICFDGERLVTSDGGSRLTFRDPVTFAVTRSVEVRRAQRPVTGLNELECVGSVVYANVWPTSAIARIDGATGRVTGWVDASALLAPEEQAAADVLNGIAFVPASGHLLITGKLWPRLLEVELVPVTGR